MNTGKDFENQIKESMPKDVYYYRLKDPSSSFGQDSSKTRFSLPNPFDFFMYKLPYLYAIENKSTATNSLSWTLNKSVKGKNIKASQILELYEAYKQGLIAGFFFNFRDVNETYFIHIKDFIDFVASTTKHSINRNEVKAFKGFLIPQKLKKVKYSYDINAFVQHSENVYNEYKEYKDTIGVIHD